MTRKPKIHAPIRYPFDNILKVIASEQRPLVRILPTRPFLKWVGGKRSILSELTTRLPEKYNKYYEPFVGGGALFFTTQPEKAYLSDMNFHLIITFQVVRDSVDLLIHQLKTHTKKHNKTYYYKAREKMFAERDNVKIASLFIYLNKTCFNGLYRVNKQGGFNVPMGNYKNPAILDEDNLRNCSKVLKGREIKQHDFTQINPVKDSFYYLDPPYHKTYNGYNGRGFGDDKHKELARFCHAINKKGGYFMLSNSDTPLVRKLYKGYTIEVVESSRTISCKGAQRGKANELIIRNYESKKDNKQRKTSKTHR